MAEAAAKRTGVSAAVLTCLGCVSAMYDWAWADAEGQLRHAIRLSPDYVAAHHWFAADILIPQGRFPEAETELAIAQQLDPLSLTVSASIGRCAYLSRRYPAAVKELARTLELDRHFGIAHFFLGQTYTEMGRLAEAVTSLQEGLRLSPSSPEILAALGNVYARSGNLDAAHNVLGQLSHLAQRRYVSPSAYAEVHAGLREHDTAIQWLERACDERATDAVWFGVRPVFDGLRSDTRCVALCRTILGA